MKKLLTTSAFTAALFALPTTEAAADNAWPHWYVGTNLGFNFTFSEPEISDGVGSNGLDLGVGTYAAGSIGYRPRMNKTGDNNLRFELEYGSRRNDVSEGSGDVYSNSLHLSAIYDFKNSKKKKRSSVTPYLGLGIGGTSVEVSDPNAVGVTDNEDQVVSLLFQAGLGFEFESLPHVEFQVGYKSLGLIESPSLDLAGGGEAEFENYWANNIEIGARFRF